MGATPSLWSLGVLLLSVAAMGFTLCPDSGGISRAHQQHTGQRQRHQHFTGAAASWRRRRAALLASGGSGDEEAGNEARQSSSSSEQGQDVGAAAAPDGSAAAAGEGDEDVVTPEGDWRRFRAKLCAGSEAVSTHSLL
jgi:hypothetical protein